MTRRKSEPKARRRAPLDDHRILPEEDEAEVQPAEQEPEDPHPGRRALARTKSVQLRQAKALAVKAARAVLRDSERLRFQWLRYFEAVARYVDASLPWEERAHVSKTRFGQLLRDDSRPPLVPGAPAIPTRRAAWWWYRFIRDQPALVQALSREWLGVGPLPPTLYAAAKAGADGSAADVRARTRSRALAAGFSPAEAERRGEMALEELLLFLAAEAERTVPASHYGYADRAALARGPTARVLALADGYRTPQLVERLGRLHGRRAAKPLP